MALMGFALPATATEEARNPPASPAAPAKPAIVLTDKEPAEPSPFLAAGIPAPSREWHGSAYEQAAQILASGSVALPRLSDAQGAALLQRITSTANFSYHRIRDVPIQARIEDYVRLLQGTNSILKLYYEAAIEGQDFYTEMATLMAFLLHVSALGVELADELIPTIPQDDTYAARMEGLRRMNSGLTSVFVGAETTLTESHIYSPEDLSIVLDAMARTLPRIKKAFPPDYRIALRQKLQADKMKFTAPADIRNFDEMIRELEM
jgi:hypothetical protein